MKIEEAILLNKEAADSLRQGKHPQHADAVLMGIAALRAALRKEIKIDLPASPKDSGEVSEATPP